MALLYKNKLWRIIVFHDVLWNWQRSNKSRRNAFYCRLISKGESFEHELQSQTSLRSVSVALILNGGSALIHQYRASRRHLLKCVCSIILIAAIGIETASTQPNQIFLEAPREQLSYYSERWTIQSHVTTCCLCKLWLRVVRFKRYQHSMQDVQIVAA